MNLGYNHARRSQRAARASGDDPSQLLPGPHRVASLATRWLLGTHQGSIDDAHLTHCLNEFVFRFNRSQSRSGGMLFYRVLELPITHGPVRYQHLISERLAAGHTVYVHCKVGYSRTAAVVGAYLVASGRCLTAEAAMAHLRDVRPPIVIRPEAEAALRDSTATLAPARS